MADGVNDQRWTVQNLFTSSVQGISSNIAKLVVEAKNFELRLILVSVVEQYQYGGLPMEDPNIYLSIF